MNLDFLVQIAHKLAEYWGLVAQGLLVMLGGMLAVFILYRLVSSVLKPEGTWARFLRVFFGAVYVMILVITVLIAASRFGYDVSGIAGIAILLVLACATVIFFLIPFMPRLPFVPGDTVEVRGVTGVVDAITAYQTVIRTFDGQIIYLPSAMVLASPIINFSSNPTRRVSIALSLSTDSSLEDADQLILPIMREHDKVLDEPAPGVLVTSVDLEGVHTQLTCWVESANWLKTRDELWRAITASLNASPTVSLAVPRLAVQQSEGC